MGLGDFQWFRMYEIMDAFGVRGGLGLTDPAGMVLHFVGCFRSKLPSRV